MVIFIRMAKILVETSMEPLVAKVSTELTIELWYSVHCSLYSVHCKVYRPQCTVYSVKCIAYIVQCTVYSIMFSVYCVPDIILCTRQPYSYYRSPVESPDSRQSDTASEIH